MRYKQKRPWDWRKKRHLWFAWYPVQVECSDGCRMWVWLEYVWRTGWDGGEYGWLYDQTPIDDHDDSVTIRPDGVTRVG